MSVRVCFLRRDHRGGALRAIRLVGQTTDETFPPEGALSGAPEDFASAARWIRERLDATRTASSIAVLCLDTDGGVCTWASAPSTEPRVLTASIRFGGADGSKPGGGAFDYFAPNSEESTLEALPVVRQASGGLRSAVLGLSDVPARLLIDALDREGIPTESAATLWHIMARAWDPGAPRPTSPGHDDAPADAGPMSAILLTDPEGRLVWCWSAAGQLKCAGSLRLRIRQPAEGDDATATAYVGADDATRLSAEWLSWAVQLGKSPRRVVCVMPPGDDTAALGEALARAWPGATIDVLGHDDPIGATLRRLADTIESTPKTASEVPSLVTLGQRPGRAHRAMFRWRALGLLLLAFAIIIVAWQLSSAADRAIADGKAWSERWRGVIQEVHPDALRPLPNTTPLSLLDEEVRRREREMLPVERTDLSMPVLAEFETISMVLASTNCGAEQIMLDSSQRPLVVTIVKSSEQAEDILQGLQRIGGSFTRGWVLSMRDMPGTGERRIRAEFRAEWDRDAVKKGAAP